MKSKLFVMLFAGTMAASLGAAETFRLDADDTIVDRKSLPILLTGKAVRKVDAAGKGAIQLRGKNFRTFQIPNDGKIINPYGGKISFRFKPYFTVKKPGDAWTVYPILSLYSSEPKSGFHLNLTHHKGEYTFSFMSFDAGKKQCSRGLKLKFVPDRWYDAAVSWDDTGIEMTLDDQKFFIRSNGALRIGNNKFFTIGSGNPDIEVMDFVISDSK